jgi:hypothetical protein
LAPIAAASLCIKPTKLLTEEQSVRVTQLKRASASFATMRRLAIRFRRLLRTKNSEQIDVGLASEKWRAGLDQAVSLSNAAGLIKSNDECRHTGL